MNLQTEPTSGETAAYAADEAAVRALFEELKEAWGAGDSQRYGALFTEEADYIAFDGVNQKGRGAIVAAHEPLFQRFLKGSRLVGDITSIRFLCPDVALIHTTGNTILAGKTTPEPARLSIQTLVAIKRDGTWRFTAFHNARVRPIAAGFCSFVAWQLADWFWKLLGTKDSQSDS